MKKTYITAILILFFSSAYAQDFKEVAGDSITDIEFAEHFFEIDLPDNFDLKVEDDGFYFEYNIDYSDTVDYPLIPSLSYNMAGIDIIMEQDTSIDISVYSLIGGRWSNVPDSSEYAETINISYYLEKDDYFVVSGIGKYSGELLYIKVSNGHLYRSILRLQYPQEKKTLIEPYISQLSKSFKSH